MKFLLEYNAFENIKLWSIAKTNPPSNTYSSLVRNILEDKRKYFNKSPYMSLRVLVGKREGEAKDLLEELYFKIPNNIKVYHNIIYPKMELLINEIKYRKDNSLDVEVYNKIIKSFRETHQKIVKGQRLSNTKDRNFLKLVYYFRHALFDFETLDKIIKLIYSINKEAYLGEYVVMNYLSTKYKANVIDPPKELDIKHGVDKQIVDNQGNVIKNIQIKIAPEVNLKDFKGASYIFVNKTSLDLSHLLSKSQKWDGLAIIDGKSIYTVGRENITSIKKVNDKNFMIKCKLGKVKKGKLSVSRENVIKTLDFLD